MAKRHTLGINFKLDPSPALWTRWCWFRCRGWDKSAESIRKAGFRRL